MIKASIAALKNLNKMPSETEKLGEAFKKHLVEAGLVSPMYSEVFEKVVGMKKMLDEKNLEKVADRDVYVNKEYVRRFVEDLRRAVDSPPEAEQLSESKKPRKKK
jgi:hypothetical protein